LNGRPLKNGKPIENDGEAADFLAEYKQPLAYREAKATTA
jgi:hypothetical protein